MDRRRLAAVVVALLGLVVVALASRTVGGRPYSLRIENHTAPLDEPTLSSPTGRPSRPSNGHYVDQGWGPVLAAALIVLAVVVAGLLVAAALRLRSLLTRQGRHEVSRRPGTPGEVGFVDAEELSAAVEDSLAELARGPVADAIVGCWLRVEAAAQEAGAALRAPETSAEFTARIVAELGVREAALRELAELYREARFSTHPMPESARERAGRCLRDVRDDLHALR